ncbi:MAG: hypothetical protein RLZZ292_1664 [Bacteroidota bacterium]|jgi:membrane associated rhomboid family serine protease
MIFPIGDDQIRGGYTPINSYIFLGLNILVFLYQFSLTPEASDVFVRTYGAIPHEVTQGYDVQTLITAMFLHGGWMHLIGNMLFLWVFADNIEATIGNVRFFLFYMMGGVAAGLTQAYLNPTSDIPCVGASGAIAAVLGAYIVLFPKSQIKILFIYFLYSFRLSALVFLGLWIVQQFISGFASLGPLTADTAGVAWWAHIGGFGFGVLAGFYFKLNDDENRGEIAYE